MGSEEAIRLSQIISFSDPKTKPQWPFPNLRKLVEADRILILAAIFKRHAELRLAHTEQSINVSDCHYCVLPRYSDASGTCHHSSASRPGE